MELFIIIISSIVLLLLGSILYVGTLLLFFKMIKKAFHMNETKWSALFRYRKGKGLYFVMTFPYVLSLGMLFLISSFWFEWMNIENSVLISIAIVILYAVSNVFKFSKLKDILHNKLA